MWKKPTKMIKNSQKNNEIQRITSKKPLKISTNCQKLKKTWRKPSKMWKNRQKCRKMGKKPGKKQ